MDCELLNPEIAIDANVSQASRIEALVMSMKNEIAVLKHQNEDIIALFLKFNMGEL